MQALWVLGYHYYLEKLKSAAVCSPNTAQERQQKWIIMES